MIIVVVGVSSGQSPARRRRRVVVEQEAPACARGRAAWSAGGSRRRRVCPGIDELTALLAGRRERAVAVDTPLSPSTSVRRRPRVGGYRSERRPHFHRRGVGEGVEEAEDAAVALRGRAYGCAEDAGRQGQFADGGRGVVGVELGWVVRFQRGRDEGTGEFARCLVGGWRVGWGMGGGGGGRVFPLAGELGRGLALRLRVLVWVRRGGVVGWGRFTGEEVAEFGVGFVLGCCGSRRLVDVSWLRM